MRCASSGVCSDLVRSRARSAVATARSNWPAEAYAAAHLAAGAHALGFVAPLFDSEEVGAGRFDLIEARARRILAAVAAAP